ncbi:MAG: class I SAM-dependent methyltransferase [Ruminococcus sp.]|jgi:23S rRNA (cytosine1962-C5)-methyltransferase|nr:class I SAM-dependent methyltransferase [Ruminococcus sp.]
MRFSDEIDGYELLDTTDGEKLERFGDFMFIRPDPQIIWKTDKTPEWRNADAHYIRSDKGGGHWEFKREIPTQNLRCLDGKIRFTVRPTGFKHMGIFPEQAVNWKFLYDLITSANRPLKVLNLFAYTGGATLAAASAGAEVTHVDASKGILQWARENAALSGLSEKPIRWINDDCEKFIRREIKRGKRYDIIIMDPPSYGRGTTGEVWKLEDSIYDLIKLSAEVLTENPAAFLLNSYTTGLSADVMEYLLALLLKSKFGGKVSSSAIGIKCASSGLFLPCGSTAIYTGE